MSRILKRPMFRSGGSTNEGIMHGLVDRKGYYQGSIDPKRTRADVQTELDILKEYAPMPKSRFPMGQIGLNLVSGEYAGDGLLSNIAGSAKGPYSQWTARDDAREQALMQRRAGAAGRSITQQRTEYAAKLKALADRKKGFKILSPEDAEIALGAGYDSSKTYQRNLDNDQVSQVTGASGTKEGYEILSKEDVERDYPMLDSSIAWQKNLDDDKVSKVGGSGVVLNIGDRLKTQIKATNPEKLSLGYQEGDDVILTKDVLGNIVNTKLVSSVDQRMQVIGKAVKDSNLQDADDALRNLENYIVYLQNDERFADNLPGIGTIGGKVPGMFASKEAIKLRALVAAYENITLKKRSGAAVTPSELARVQNELAGAVNTPDESVFLDILGINRKILEKQKKATFAIHRKSDVDSYWESGGLSLYETPLSELSTEELLEKLSKG